MEKKYRIKEERGVFFIEYEIDRDVFEPYKWFSKQEKIGSEKVWLTACALEGDEETLSFPYLKFETLQKAKDYIPKLDPKYYYVDAHKTEIVASSENAYSEKDLVAFGNYLLSSERKAKFEESQGGLSILERLGMVHYSDLENFLESKNKCSRCTEAVSVQILDKNQVKSFEV